MELVIALVGAIIGAFVGWFLNEWSTSRRERPKLCFHMTGTPENELIEKEYRTKTSASEYAIEVFNVGKNAFILDRFSLCYNGKTLVNCFIDDAKRVILPNDSIVYTLMEQDADALQYHCNQYHFGECDIIAYSVDGKKVKGKLEVPLFALRASFTESYGIV